MNMKYVNTVEKKKKHYDEYVNTVEKKEAYDTVMIMKYVNTVEKKKGLCLTS